MSNLKLKKKLKIDVKKMLENESKELSKENIEKWKAISSFLCHRCLECNHFDSSSLHLLLGKNNELHEKVESKKLGFIAITTNDVQTYAKHCGLKFSLGNTFCCLTWQ